MNSAHFVDSFGFTELQDFLREQIPEREVMQDTSGYNVQRSEKEIEVTLTVAECGEFHNLGEFYENIPTVEEAIAIWKQIPLE